MTAEKAPVTLRDALEYRDAIEDFLPETLRLATPNEAAAVLVLARAALAATPDTERIPHVLPKDRCPDCATTPDTEAKP